MNTWPVSDESAIRLPSGLCGFVGDCKRMITAGYLPRNIYVITHTWCGTYMFARHTVLVSATRQYGLTDPERARRCRVNIDIPSATGARIRRTFGVKRDRPCLWGVFSATHLARRGERALTRFPTLDGSVKTLVTTDNGVRCDIPQTCRTIQAVIQHRMAIGGNGEGYDGEIVWWACERDLSRGRVPLFYRAVCRCGEDCVSRCPSDIPYFVAVSCVEFNPLENSRTGRGRTRNAYVLCNRER